VLHLFKYAEPSCILIKFFFPKYSTHQKSPDMSLALSEACNATTFAPVVFGAEILTLDDSVVTNYSASVPDAFRFTAPSVELRNATFCNVTLSYTYPGQNDEVIVEAWLPLEGWNGRFQAVGGGGWVAGRSAISYGAMGGALADGFATITTDAGLGDAMDASEWALTSPGNINWSNLHNLASITLNDEVWNNSYKLVLTMNPTDLPGYHRQIADRGHLRKEA
jgi:hypothetical protein